MTTPDLRDQMATAALTGLLANGGTLAFGRPEVIATQAYRLADAMLAERNRTAKEGNRNG